MKKIKKTKKEQVLAFLKLGLRLNPLIAQREMGLIGSTLAYYIHELRNEGWDVQTEVKTSSYSQNRYAEYILPPSWRLVKAYEYRETLKRLKRQVPITSLRIGDRVLLDDGLKGIVETLASSGMFVIKEKNGKEHLINIYNVSKKLRR